MALAPGHAVANEDVGGAGFQRVGSVVGITHQGHVAPHGHRRAELPRQRAIGGADLLLELPGRRGAPVEDRRARPLALVPAFWAPGQHRIPAQGHRLAQPARCARRRGELLLMGPLGAAAGKDVDRAHVRSGRVIARRPHRHAVPFDGHRAAQEVVGPGAGRQELGLLAPGLARPHHDVRRAGVPLVTRGLGRHAHHRRVAIHGDGGRGIIPGVMFQQDELLGLTPAAPLAREGVQLLLVEAVGGEDQRVVAAQGQVDAEERVRVRVGSHELRLLVPGLARPHERIRRAHGEASSGKWGARQDRVAIHCHRVAELMVLLRISCGELVGQLDRGRLERPGAARDLGAVLRAAAREKEPQRGSREARATIQPPPG